MEGKASGVNIRGAFYELTDADLSAAYPLGVSNEYGPRLRRHHPVGERGRPGGGGNQSRLKAGRNILGLSRL